MQLKRLRAIKLGPVPVTGPPVPLTGPSVPLTGPRLPLQGPLFLVSETPVCSILFVRNFGLKIRAPQKHRFNDHTNPTPHSAL